MLRRGHAPPPRLADRVRGLAAREVLRRLEVEAPEYATCSGRAGLLRPRASRDAYAERLCSRTSSSATPCA